MRNMMHKKIFLKATGLLLVTLLTGCAATPIQQEAVTPDRLTAKNEAEITKTPSPDNNNPPASGATAKPMEQAQSPGKTASKVQTYPGTGVFVKAPATSSPTPTSRKSALSKLSAISPDVGVGELAAGALTNTPVPG